MMFANGMGIGLMFWGVAEPLTYLTATDEGSIPPGRAAAGTPEAARTAMEYAFFHWGLHPWSMYAVIGLAIGYFAYRKGYGNTISATFRPLLGKRAGQAPGKAIDIIAIFATLFGSATSLASSVMAASTFFTRVFSSVRVARLRTLRVSFCRFRFFCCLRFAMRVGAPELSDGRKRVAPRPRTGRSPAPSARMHQ